MSLDVSIGQLSKQTGCKIPTIRWYEAQGLLPPAGRTAGNQRRYSDQHVRVLRFICHTRSLGFDLDAVRQLLQLSARGKDAPHTADDIAKQHLASVRERIRKLQQLEHDLEHLINSCEGDVAHECRVLSALGEGAAQSADALAG
ncbi:MAG TPA: transcriptional regulator [Gammaproteobacteria bacterium]|jgi:DNA-binding transcriptional MerR regulator|nr:transcriptional regulator [Gammaproteobacteria bacterium]